MGVFKDMDARAKEERLRILQLALATFVVETTLTVRDLRRTNCEHMANALQAEVGVASELLDNASAMLLL